MVKKNNNNNTKQHKTKQRKQKENDQTEKKKNFLLRKLNPGALARKAIATAPRHQMLN